MGKEQRRVKGSRASIATITAVTLLACIVGAADESGLANQCSKDFQSVMSCLNFAQGKQSQTSGAQSLKSMGVQQDKLFQLPSACQLKNASVSDCPKVLGLAPNSPDAAIFTNRRQRGRRQLRRRLVRRMLMISPAGRSLKPLIILLAPCYWLLRPCFLFLCTP
ncbi:Glycosylphosphatidylinositol-anchored lipid protein transfer 1, putative isoform 2 [Hibiscus syriacus]|uniref:Glycosylphosphatidylinositol-anchored lipid protein transfer 1, putative isoform 2 n=1 Tax=Hibiscus syriacus TaxID=106335 RepID=A0A6A3BRM3_HIBSY|nr:Glycosylphosphatidylinositol-anchored lipid protein transfer 1, putative isoform 2 [Hibiscus syriacus]